MCLQATSLTALRIAQKPRARAEQRPASGPLDHRATVGRRRATVNGLREGAPIGLETRYGGLGAVSARAVGANPLDSGASVTPRKTRPNPTLPLSCLLAASSVLVAPVAGAQYELSATARAPRAAFDSTRSEEHVDRAQADRAAAAGTGDMLEHADGVVVQRTSSASAAPVVRGLTGHRVLLMQDQLRLNDSLTRPGGNALLNLIDPESVQRVEVVRGPASVLYGSDALGGVVRVLTHRQRRPALAAPQAGATAYARGASAERALRVQGAVQGSVARLAARVSGAVGEAGETLRGGGLGEQPFTGHDDWSLAGRAEAALAPGHTLDLAYQSGHLLDVPRSDVSAPGDVQTTKRLDRETALLSYVGRLPEHGLRLRAHAGLVLRREWRQRVQPDQLRDERDRVFGIQAGLSAVSSPWSTAQLEFGTEAVLEDIGSASVARDASGASTTGRGRYLDGSRYDSYAVYALLSQALGESWTLMGGARGTLVHARAPLDPDFASELAAARRLDRALGGVVGSLGARYDASAELSLVASLMSGFRAPNLEDYQAFGGGARGYTIPNPELDQERSWTLETGAKLDDDAWRFETYLWGSLLTGLIERVPTSFQGQTEIDGQRVQTPMNASRSALLGAELALRRTLESGLFAGVSAFGTYGVTERPDADGGDVSEPASKVPPPIGALELGFEPHDLPFWLQGVLSAQLPQPRLSESDRDDVRICEQGPTGCTEAAGYVDLTLRVGLSLPPSLLVTLALENVIDAGYKTFASGAYAPGRNAVLAVRGTL